MQIPSKAEAFIANMSSGYNEKERNWKELLSLQEL